MSAVVFCLACEQVMDITEYLHPSHKCAVRTPTPRRVPAVNQTKEGTDPDVA
jgi:hypothetical protein